MAENVNSEAKWYVVHTYSGYENKVKANIEKTVENRSMHDQILEVSVPLETVEDEKTGKMVERKIFPGYVLVHMVMNDNTWYVVRNTRGVTGFVGPASKPVPLSDEEVAVLGTHKTFESEFEVGDAVVISDGVMVGAEGKVTEVNAELEQLVVSVFVMGRETPTELKFSQVKKV